MAANSRATYIRYFTAGKMQVKQKGVLPILVKQSGNVPAAKTLCITQPNDPSLFIFSQEDILVKIQDTDASVKNNNEPAQFHTNSLYRHAKAPLEKLLVQLLKQDEEQLPTFVLFLDTMYHITEIVFYSITCPFISTMRPFDHDSRNKCNKWGSKLRCAKADFS